jgi:two-component system sensor histidine kinase EvgS
MPTFVAPRQILLIDDHGPCRQVLAQLLRAAGHRVAEADGGAAGLARLRQVPPDLVVTDRDMPGLTGWDVAQLVKATHPHLPVVLVTGGVDANTAGCTARTYVDAILGKPFPVAELLAVIARLTDGASAPVKPNGARNTCPAGRCPTGSQRGGAIWRES